MNIIIYFNFKFIIQQFKHDYSKQRQIMNKFEMKFLDEFSEREAILIRKIFL